MHEQLTGHPLYVCLNVPPADSEVSITSKSSTHSRASWASTQKTASDPPAKRFGCDVARFPRAQQSRCSSSEDARLSREVSKREGLGRP